MPQKNQNSPRSEIEQINQNLFKAFQTAKPKNLVYVRDYLKILLKTVNKILKQKEIKQDEK